MYTVCLIVLLYAAATIGQAFGASPPVPLPEPPSLTAEHGKDVIVYLWWALGLLASASVTVSAAVGSWMLLRILAHEKAIAALKASCAIRHHEEKGE